MDESALTGESNNVEKNPEELSAGDYPLGDRANMGYKGTSITSGRALAYVVATGMDTELGNIAKMIQTDETATPLQKRLAAFGKRLSVTILIICTVIFFIGWLRGESVLIYFHFACCRSHSRSIAGIGNHCTCLWCQEISKKQCAHPEITGCGDIGFRNLYLLR
ncbi:hypothetical protein [Flavobacterium sp. ZB4R12]|uniref:P-type ATPase n=1 Tax=Flavobacterium sp. ZB4R12 TaxID=3398732 RepID=UPI003AAEEFFC